MLATGNQLFYSTKFIELSHDRKFINIDLWWKIHLKFSLVDNSTGTKND